MLLEEVITRDLFRKIDTKLSFNYRKSNCDCRNTLFDLNNNTSENII